MTSNNNEISNTTSEAYYAKVKREWRLTSKGEDTATAVYTLLEIVQLAFLSDEVVDVDRNVKYAVIGIF